MPREKVEKKVVKLRHEPLKNQMEKRGVKAKGKKKTIRSHPDADVEDEGDTIDDNFDTNDLPFNSNSRKDMRIDESYEKNEFESWARQSTNKLTGSSSNQYIEEVEDNQDDYQDESVVDEEEYDDEYVELDGDHFAATGLSESEEATVQKFLSANQKETRTLADIIMDKIRQSASEHDQSQQDSTSNQRPAIPQKVMEVYTAVGSLLHHYKSGKLPKALKMLPHLKNWEEVLWLTRPDEWTPCATYACTRIFASNLNAKMAQRFYNLVLLEKCRDDIRENKTLNFHLYMALKKALYKPAAFYKGVLLPLVQSQSCTLREATIFGSVILKVSVPANHSAAVLLKLTELPYTGSSSLFIRVLLSKRYALPRRVVDALVDHFVKFEEDSRSLPVIWHQSLLAFAQRYKLELDEDQRRKLRSLLKSHSHHSISPEIRRELFGVHISGVVPGVGDMEGDNRSVASLNTKKSVKSVKTRNDMEV